MGTLLDQKYDKLFSLLDTNGNGVLTKTDFEQMTDKLLAAFEEDRSTEKGKHFAGEMTNYWNALREVADADFDGQITQDEFRQAVFQVSDNFDTLIAPLYRSCFLLADSDDDGLVSKEEFIAAEVAIGVPSPDADATYDRLTEQGGQLTMDTVVTAVGQYYRNDSAGDGNLFFGRL